MEICVFQAKKTTHSFSFTVLPLQGMGAPDISLLKLHEDIVRMIIPLSEDVQKLRAVSIVL